MQNDLKVRPKTLKYPYHLSSTDIIQTLEKVGIKSLICLSGVNSLFVGGYFLSVPWDYFASINLTRQYPRQK